MKEQKLTLRWGCYNHSLRQVANLFNKVILCVQRHVTMFVQVYANSLNGEQIMNIKKWEVWHNVHSFKTLKTTQQSHLMFSRSCTALAKLSSLCRDLSSAAFNLCIRAWNSPVSMVTLLSNWPSPCPFMTLGFGWPWTGLKFAIGACFSCGISGRSSRSKTKHKHWTRNYSQLLTNTFLLI